MINLRVMVAAVVVTSVLSAVAPAAPLGHEWKRVDSRAGAQAADFVAVGGRLIAVGEGGAIWETSDRLTWSISDSKAFENLNSVATGNGVVVAVGAAGTIVRSDTAGIWTAEDFTVPTDLRGVTYGDGKFVAVAKSGAAFYSTDGRTWLDWPTGQLTPLNQVAWDGSGFIACGDSGLLLKASPGGEWSSVANPMSSGGYRFTSLAGGVNGWVVGVPQAWWISTPSLYSADGITWDPVTSMTFNDLVAGSGKFVGVSTAGMVQRSDDGITWTSQQTPVSADFVSVQWTGSDFVAMTAMRQLSASGDGKRWKTKGLMDNTTAGCWDGTQYVVVGDKGKIFTSPDGRMWTSEVNADPNNLKSVASGNGRLIAVGDEGAILRSPDGRDWQRVALPVGWDFTDVHWSGTAFWAVGEGGVVLTSADGLAWTVRDPGTLDAVVWDGNRYLAFSGRTVIASSDGNAWQPLAEVPWPGNSTPPEKQMRQILWTGAGYVAIGQSRWILHSVDGVQWTRAQIDGFDFSSPYFNSIAWSGTRFVAMAETKNEFAVSDDGLNWTGTTSAGMPGYITKKVIWDGTRFIAFSGNILFTSANGTEWTQLTTITSGGAALNLQSIAWDGTRYIAAGSGGDYGGGPRGAIIGTSPNGVNWTFLPVDPDWSLTFTHVACDAGSAVVMRNDGVVKRWNGSSWVEENPGLSGTPAGLIKAGASYVSFSQTGMASVFAATGSWQPGDQRVNGQTLSSIISANGVLVAGGQGWSGGNASIMRSTDDGRNWTKEAFAGAQGPFLDPVWTGSNFLMVGANHPYVSTDGTGWTATAPSWDGQDVLCLALFGGKTVMAGNDAIWVDDESGFRKVKEFSGATVRALISNGSELLAIGTNDTMASSDGELWTTIDPDPAIVPNLSDVVHTPEGFFACGDAGRILHSADGETWTERAVAGLPKLNAMIHTSLGLVGVGNGFAFSADGQTWTCQSDGRNFRGVAFGNGLLVAVENSHAAVSSDGIHWQINPHGMTASNVVWNGSEFVMTLTDRGVAVSSDGITWKVVVLQGDVTGCCASVDTFIACNTHGNLYRSTDGLHWSLVLDSYAGTGPMRVVRTGNLFFSFGSSIHSSADGSAWAARTRNHNDIVWTGERYIAIGNSGVAGVSVNGTTWTTVASGTTRSLNRVIWTGSGLIAVGNGGILLTSSDGLAWAPAASGSTKDLVDVVIYNGKWIALASDGSLVCEVAGPEVPERFAAKSLLVDGETLVAVGAKGRIAMLSGNSWSEVASPTYWDLLAVCNTPVGLHACGKWNVMLRRSDGGEWQPLAGGMSGVPAGIATEQIPKTTMAGGQLVSLGDRGLVATSSLGRVWYPQTRPSASVLRDVIDVDGQLLAVGDKGVVARLTEGTSTLESRPTNLDLRALASAGQRLVAVGEDGVILLSASAPEIELSKTGEGPLVSGVSSVAFGYGASSDVSAVTFTIANSGITDLSGLSLEFGGDHAGDFRIYPAFSKTSLTPGESTTFTVLFMPDAVGTRSASLIVHSNDSDESPFTVSLTGSASSLAPELVVEALGEGPVTSGETLGFGNVKPRKKVIRTLVLRNVGSGRLTGLSMLKSGPNAADFKVAPKKLKTILKPGKSIRVKVVLSSKIGGTKEGLIRISSNDPANSVFALNLAGSVQVVSRTAARGGGEPMSVKNDGSDADGDGLSDFMEWAIGSDPSAVSSSPTTLSLDGDRLVFGYTRSQEAIAAGVTFEVEWSDNLQLWQTAGVREKMARAAAAGSDVQQVQAEVPRGENPHRFVRLRIETPR